MSQVAAIDPGILAAVRAARGRNGAASVDAAPQQLDPDLLAAVRAARKSLVSPAAEDGVDASQSSAPFRMSDLFGAGSAGVGAPALNLPMLTQPKRPGMGELRLSDEGQAAREYLARLPRVDPSVVGQLSDTEAMRIRAQGADPAYQEPTTFAGELGRGLRQAASAGLPAVAQDALGIDPQALAMERPASGVGGFIGENIGGFAGLTNPAKAGENLLSIMGGGAAGKAIEPVAAKFLQWVTPKVGPALGRALAIGMDEAAQNGGPGAVLGIVQRAQAEKWGEDPAGAVMRTLGAGVQGAAMTTAGGLVARGVMAPGARALEGVASAARREPIPREIPGRAEALDALRPKRAQQVEAGFASGGRTLSLDDIVNEDAAPAAADATGKDALQVQQAAQPAEAGAAPAPEAGAVPPVDEALNRSPDQVGNVVDGRSGVQVEQFTPGVKPTYRMRSAELRAELEGAGVTVPEEATRGQLARAVMKLRETGESAGASPDQPLPPASDTRSQTRPDGTTPDRLAESGSGTSLESRTEPSSSPESTQREPWQMTRAEHVANETRNSRGSSGAVETYKELVGKRHAEAVRAAVDANKPVPPEVLADYPDLAAKATPPQMERRIGIPLDSPDISRVFPELEPMRPSRSSETRPLSTPEQEAIARSESGPGGGGEGRVRPVPEASEAAPATFKPLTAHEGPKLEDRLAKAADERLKAIKSRQIRRGPNTGQTTVFNDVVDLGAYVALKAAEKGVRTGKAFRDFAAQTIDEVAPHLKESAAQVRRIAAGLMRDSTDASGKVDEAAFERSLSNLDEYRASRAVTRAGVDELTGVKKPTEKPTIKAGAALRQKLRAQEKAATAAYAEAKKVEREKGQRSVETVRNYAKEEAQRAEVRARWQKSFAVKAAKQAGQDALRMERQKAKQDIQILKNRAKWIAHFRLKDAEAAAKMKSETEAALQAEAVRVAQTLPPAVRGRVLPAIRDAKTYAGLGRALSVMQDRLSEYDARADLKTLDKYAAKRTMRKLGRGEAGRMGRYEAAEQLTREVEGIKAQLRPKAGTDPLSRTDRLAAHDRLSQIVREMVALHHDQKRDNKVYVVGKAVDAQRVRNDMVQRIQRRGERGDARSVDEAPRTGIAERYILKPFMTPETKAMVLDGAFGDRPDQVGSFRRVIVSGPQRAQARAFNMFRDTMMKLDEAAKRAGYKDYSDARARLSGALGEGLHERVDVPLAGTAKISKGMAMDLLARDPSTVDAFLSGVKATSEKNPTAEGFAITSDTLDKVRDALTPKERMFVREVKDAMHELFPQLDAANMRLKGYGLEKVLDYYPRRRNLAASEQRGLPEGWREITAKHWENAGLTKEREGGKTPILIGDFLSTVEKHVWAVSHIVHTAETVRALEQTLLHPEVRAEMTKRFGTSWVKWADQYVKDASGASMYQSWDSVDGLLRRITSNVTKSKVALNPSSWLKNLGGIIKLSGELSPGELAAGMKAFGDTKLMEDLSKRSGYFWHRYNSAPHSRYSGISSGADLVTGSSLREGLRGFATSARRMDAKGAASSWSTAWDSIKVSNWFDSAPAKVAYAASLAKVRKQHPTWTADRQANWAARQAERAFRRTQNTVDALDAPEITQRAKSNPVATALMAFTSDATKSLDMLIRAAYQAKITGERKHLVRTTAALTGSMLWSAAVTTALYKLTHAGPKTDSTEEKFAKSMTNELAQTFVPGFGDTLAAIARGQYGSDITTPLFDSLNQAARATMSLLHPPKKRKPGQQRRQVLRLASALADLTGTPVAPLVRFIGGAWDAANED